VRNPNVSPWFPLLIMAYPIWETIYSMYRRKMQKKQKVGEPDSKHLHQLVYRSCLDTISEQYSKENAKKANSSVFPKITIWLIPITASGMVFWQSSITLIALALLFCVAYVMIYRKLDHS
jgi:UDP-N-acetylmuramyl pentapeptide phosphotransferase/UDP-N-acetylglucosamine-1-phosphate transferase